jgi:rsbT co-antagonist protein RsbR
VPDIDSVVANQLIGSVAAAHMMGAAVIVSGLSAEIAQTLVTAGIDLSDVDSVGDLQSGIERAERMLWT